MTFQEFQRGLIRLGYDLGRAGADGVPGRMTAAATIAFKVKRGLSATPAIGPQTIAAMATALREKGTPAPAPRTPPAPVWMIEAQRNLSVREVAGPKSDPTILGWAKRLGSRVLGMNYVEDGTPWCGLFVAHCVELTLPGEPLPSIVVRASSWDRFGRSSSRGFGAILRFQRPGGGHVGFYAGETADGRFLKVLGGNQSNRVSYAMIESSRLVAVRWPSTGGETRERVIVDAKGTPMSSNEQ